MATFPDSPIAYGRSPSKLDIEVAIARVRLHEARAALHKAAGRGAAAEVIAKRRARAEVRSHFQKRFGKARKCLRPRTDDTAGVRGPGDPHPASEASKEGVDRGRVVGAGEGERRGRVVTRKQEFIDWPLDTHPGTKRWVWAQGEPTEKTGEAIRREEALRQSLDAEWSCYSAGLCEIIDRKALKSLGRDKAARARSVSLANNSWLDHWRTWTRGRTTVAFSSEPYNEDMGAAQARAFAEEHDLDLTIDASRSSWNPGSTTLFLLRRKDVPWPPVRIAEPLLPSRAPAGVVVRKSSRHPPTTSGLAQSASPRAYAPTAAATLVARARAYDEARALEESPRKRSAEKLQNARKISADLGGIATPPQTEGATMGNMMDELLKRPETRKCVECNKQKPPGDFATLSFRCFSCAMPVTASSPLVKRKRGRPRKIAPAPLPRIEVLGPVTPLVVHTLLPAAPAALAPTASVLERRAAKALEDWNAAFSALEQAKALQVARVEANKAAEGRAFELRLHALADTLKATLGALQAVLPPETGC